MKYFSIIHQILPTLKFLALFGMSPIYLLIRINLVTEPLNVFFWDILLGRKDIEFLILKLNKCSLPEMFNFLNMYFLLNLSLRILYLRLFSHHLHLFLMILWQLLSHLMILNKLILVINNCSLLNLLFLHPSMLFLLDLIDPRSYQLNLMITHAFLLTYVILPLSVLLISIS